MESSKETNEIFYGIVPDLLNARPDKKKYSEKEFLIKLHLKKQVTVTVSGTD